MRPLLTSVFYKVSVVVFTNIVSIMNIKVSMSVRVMNMSMIILII